MSGSSLTSNNDNDVGNRSLVETTGASAVTSNIQEAEESVAVPCQDKEPQAPQADAGEDGGKSQNPEETVDPAAEPRQSNDTAEAPQPPLKRSQSSGSVGSYESVDASSSSGIFNWGVPVPKYNNKGREIIPSPVPSPQQSFRKSLQLPAIHAPKLGSWEDDDDDTKTSGSDHHANRKEREEAHIKRLVTMAKQQQNLMAAWFAASAGEGATFFPVRSPGSKSNSRRSSKGSKRLDVPAKKRATPGAPIDLDSGEEWTSDNSDSQSAASSASRLSKITAAVSRAFTSDAGVRGDDQDDYDIETAERAHRGNKTKWYLTRNALLLISLCVCVFIAIVIASIATTVVANNNKNSNSDGKVDGSETVPTIPEFPSQAPSIMPSTSNSPTFLPSSAPSPAPSTSPSVFPSMLPSTSPTDVPTSVPSVAPTMMPSVAPSDAPSSAPSVSPTLSQVPSMAPSNAPSTDFSTTEFELIGQGLPGSQSGEEFGGAVALSQDGSVLCVGAKYFSTLDQSRIGRVLCFERDTDPLSNSGWVPRGQDLVGRNDEDQFGYAISLSRDGNRLAVSETGFDGGGGSIDRSGNVRVLQWSAEADLWIPLGNEIEGEGEADFFGFSLALAADGERLIVGSPYHDSGGLSLNGRIRVYDLVDNVWKETGSAIDGDERSEWFGWSVDISDDGQVIAAGSPRNSKFKGYVKVFYWEDGNWVPFGETIRNTVGSAGSNDRFGSSISLSPDGQHIAIGAPWRSSRRGMVVVYTFAGFEDEWSLEGSPLIGSNVSDELGESVFLNSLEILAVGIPGYSMGQDQGLVTFHRFDGSDWDSTTALLTGTDKGDDFGSSLAISRNGSILAVGAISNSNGGSGYAHSYRILS